MSENEKKQNKRLQKPDTRPITVEPRSVSVIESDTGKTSFENLTVKISKTTEITPEPPIYHKIGLIVTGGTSFAGWITPETDLSSYSIDVLDQPQLENFIGSVYLIVVQSPVEVTSSLENANGLFNTLIVAPSLADNNLNNDVDHWLTLAEENILIISATGSVTTDSNLIGNARIGVFIDSTNQGKATWTYTRFLEQINLANRIDLNNDAFLGLNDENLIPLIEEDGYSFYFKNTNLTWARSLLINKTQSEIIYQDLRLNYEIKVVGSKIIGQGYNDDNLIALEGNIKAKMNELVTQEVIDSVLKVQIPKKKNQTASDISKGIVRGIKIEYTYLGVILALYINLDGRY